ncbi:hypothetical protein GQ53DRAFT_352574 [Thozetella sp. PMI_491]|nr:hypothetical protein GQ53DRAFT_352574 [Thozetella sp. PMI_491]
MASTCCTGFAQIWLPLRLVDGELVIEPRLRGGRARSHITFELSILFVSNNHFLLSPQRTPGGSPHPGAGQQPTPLTCHIAQQRAINVSLSAAWHTTHHSQALTSPWPGPRPRGASYDVACAAFTQALYCAFTQLLSCPLISLPICRQREIMGGRAPVRSKCCRTGMQGARTKDEL